MRYLGQEHTVKVAVTNGKWDESAIAESIARFHEAHEQLYTFKLEGSSIEIVNLHLTAFGNVKKPEMYEIESSVTNGENALKEIRKVLFEDYGWVDTKVYDRDKLAGSVSIDGPAIIEEQSASTVIYPGQTLTVDKYGNLIIKTEV